MINTRVALRSQPVRHWKHIVLALSALVALGLIIWASFAVFQQPCRLDSPSHSECTVLIVDLMPLLVALGFWGVGLFVWLAIEHNPITGLFLLVAATLAVGKLGALESDLGSRLFYISLAWLAPVTLHFHFTLLEKPVKRLGYVILIALAALATIWATPFLLWSLEILTQWGWFPFLRLQVRLTLLISVLFSVLLLVGRYWNNPIPVARRRIRLILFGTILAVAPLLLLSVLPSTLGTMAFIPYEYTFPWLFLIPLFYLYSLFRHRLTNAEATLNHAAVYYLLTTLLLGIYLLVTIVLNRLIMEPERWLLTYAAVSTGLVILFMPLQNGVRRLTNWVWYSEEKNYIELIGNLTSSLSLALDRETLRHLLMDELCSAMRLSKFALLLKDQENDFQLLDSIGFELSRGACKQVPVSGPLIRLLETSVTPLSRLQIKKRLHHYSISTEEAYLLNCEDFAWWVPLTSGGELQGLLLLAERPEGDFLTFEDIRILTVVSRQSGIAAHNVRLMEQVRSGREELARAHQQLLAAHEWEQRRLANELHDVTVQQLLGISYQLLENERLLTNNKNDSAQEIPLAPALAEIRQEILDVAVQLRGVIGTLHPAGLEELGLTSALHGYFARLTREGGAQMPGLVIEMAEIGPELSAKIAITLFRIVQESLRNTVKHAEAKCVTIRLTWLEDGIRLLISDDGCGFRVPTRLSELTNDEHYGLIGMAERVSWTEGQLNIRSTQGRGTEIKVFIPLKKVKEQ